MWSFSVHDTLTGEKLAPVEVSSGRWGRAPGSSSGEHTFQMLDPDMPIRDAVARRLMTPNACSLVVALHGVPMHAGLVISAKYRRTQGTGTLRHVDIRELFKERLTFGVTSYPLGDLTLTGKNLSGLVRGILQRALFTYGGNWGLPVDLPADGSGSNDLVVKNWEWATIEDLLKRVEKLGATIDFDPYFDSNGGLRWRTRVGTPTLSGAQHEWVVTADDSPVVDLEVDLNGSQQLSGCFYMGKGAEADMRFGEAGFIGGPSIPVRDAARSAKDVSDVAKLNQMALTDLQANRSPKVEWSFSLVIDESWDATQIKPGARLKLWTYGDPFIEDGATDLVVTGVSGDMSSILRPEVMPL